jgi:hypothetical protein
MNEQPCDECLRREVIRCFENALTEIPEDINGFGDRLNPYVQGVADAARFSLERTIEEIKKLNKELKEYGMPIGGVL